MSVRQINTANYDYNMMLEAINKSYKGKSDITLSAYDTTAAPDVKTGSVWEDNGAILILESADMTPSGYAGIAVSTTFYLYYDESAEVFIYSSTAPTWSDALQGWYNGNDRAFFSMYKDSGGTLYETKLELIHQNKNQIAGGLQTDNVLLKTKIIEIGDWDMDTTIEISVIHGVDQSKIRSISAIIRDDADSVYSDFSTARDVPNETGTKRLNATTTSIALRRATGGLFDLASYNSTSYNRGWITIKYEV